jgi:ubiquinone/menaquinone biosynthesis C-methylase UbiE
LPSEQGNNQPFGELRFAPGTNGSEKLMTVEEKARRIFAERAAFYTTSTVHADPSGLARVVALAAPRPEWAALDIATGSGHTALALAPYVTSVVGIDLTPEMLAEAERLCAGHAVGNVTFRQGDVHHLPFADASFDLVTCRRAAHHFSDIALALREIRRVSRPGGRLVIDDRSVAEDDFVDRSMNQLDWYHDESHVREYRPSEWRRMLAACGLVVESVETFTRHRPLSALTDGVSAANSARIRQVLDDLTDGQRLALNVVDAGGQTFLNHWYVLIAARKAW